MNPIGKLSYVKEEVNDEKIIKLENNIISILDNIDIYNNYQDKYDNIIDYFNEIEYIKELNNDKNDLYSVLFELDNLLELSNSNNTINNYNINIFQKKNHSIKLYNSINKYIDNLLILETYIINYLNLYYLNKNEIFLNNIIKEIKNDNIFFLIIKRIVKNIIDNNNNYENNLVLLNQYKNIEIFQLLLKIINYKFFHQETLKASSQLKTSSDPIKSISKISHVKPRKAKSLSPPSTTLIKTSSVLLPSTKISNLSVQKASPPSTLRQESPQQPITALSNNSSTLKTEPPSPQASPQPISERITVEFIIRGESQEGGNNKTKLINTKLVKHFSNKKFKIYFDPINNIFIGKYKKEIINILNPFINDKEEIQLYTKKFLVNNKFIKDTKDNNIIFIRYKDDYKFIYNPKTNKKYKILKSDKNLFVSKYSYI